MPFQVWGVSGALQHDYEVQIIEDGTRFRWEIRRRRDSFVVERSERRFETRGEALGDSVLAKVWQLRKDSD